MMLKVRDMHAQNSYFVGRPEMAVSPSSRMSPALAGFFTHTRKIRP